MGIPILARWHLDTESATRWGILELLQSFLQLYTVLVVKCDLYLCVCVCHWDEYLWVTEPNRHMNIAWWCHQYIKTPLAFWRVKYQILPIRSTRHLPFDGMAVRVTSAKKTYWLCDIFTGIVLFWLEVNIFNLWLLDTCTIKPFYNTITCISFLYTCTPIWHSIACLWGRGLECLLWVHSLICILHF